MENIGQKMTVSSVGLRPPQLLWFDPQSAANSRIRRLIFVRRKSAEKKNSATRSW